MEALLELAEFIFQVNASGIPGVWLRHVFPIARLKSLYLFYLFSPNDEWSAAETK